MSKPYNFLYNHKDNSYSFTTINGIAYYVYFSDGSGYFDKYPDLSPLVYLFGFLTHSKEIPADLRVRDTIIKIVLDYFDSNSNNILMYVCDTNDKQEVQRSRKFNSWYKTVPNSGIVKLDQTICFDTCNYISVMFKESNPYSSGISAAFRDLEKDLFK